MKDHVIDHMVRKNNFPAGFCDSISQDVIVGAVIGHESKSAERFHAFTPYDHRGAERELHAFEHVGNDNSRGHLDRVSECLELSPEAACR